MVLDKTGYYPPFNYKSLDLQNQINKCPVGPCGRAVKSAVIDHLTAGVGSSPALATYETSQVLLAGVSGGYSRGSPVFAPPTDWPVSYKLK